MGVLKFCLLNSPQVISLVMLKYFLLPLNELISPWCRIYTSVNCVSIASGNGLSPVRRQAITWTNHVILSIGPLRTNFSEILIENQTFSFKKMISKMSSVKWRPFCLGLKGHIWQVPHCKQWNGGNWLSNPHPGNQYKLVCTLSTYPPRIKTWASVSIVSGRKLYFQYFYIWQKIFEPLNTETLPKF